MDFEKIFNTLAKGARCYNGYKTDYWDGVEDCACAIVDALEPLPREEAKEIKNYVAELRESLFDESDF